MNKSASNTVLNIRSTHAEQIIAGRESASVGPEKRPYKILGLEAFDQVVSMIFNAARNDDPYADWCLLNLEQHTEKTEQLLNESLNAANKLIEKKLSGLSSKISFKPSSLPSRNIDVNLNTPFGYQLAYLILSFDELVVTLEGQKQKGLISATEAHNCKRQAVRGLERLIRETAK